MKKTLILGSIAVLVICACVYIYVTHKNHTDSPAKSVEERTATAGADTATYTVPSDAPAPGEVLAYTGDMPDYGEWMISWDELENILHSIDNESYRNRMISAVKNGLFQDRDQYLMTNLFMELIYGSINNDVLTKGGYYSKATTLLRYKKLIPFLAETIITCNTTSNIMVASHVHGMLSHIPHPDTLKAILYIDEQMPADSPLRQGNISAWSGAFPLFMRDDCLDVYIAVMRSPGTYSYNRWYHSLEMIRAFTNNTAIAAMADAEKINKNWQNYWPYDEKTKNSAQFNEYMIERFRDVQLSKLDGKGPMPPAPEPLLDE